MILTLPLAIAVALIAWLCGYRYGRSVQRRVERAKWRALTPAERCDPYEHDHPINWEEMQERAI